MFVRKHLSYSLAALLAATLTAGAWADYGSSSGASSGSPSGSSTPSASSTPKSSSSISNSSSGITSSNQNNQQAPEGFVLIREDVVYLMASEPQNHFVRALQDLSLKDSKKAGAEISIAATYLDELSSRAKGQDQQTLSQCVGRLRDASKQVADGKMSDPKQLSQDFAQANLALASHFQSTADADLGANKRVQAGHDLQSAALAYQQAFAWSNQTPDQKASQAIQDATAAASNLMGPTQDMTGQSPSSGQPGQTTPRSLTGQPNASAPSPQQASKELASQIQQLHSDLTKNSNTPANSSGTTANEK